MKRHEKLMNQDDIDNKTPKSKFKSVMRKFENDENKMMKKCEKMKKETKMKNERNEDERENVKETEGISVKTFNTLGESWKGTHWETLMPSSVRSPESSAAKRADKGQLFNIFRQGNMCRNDKGNEEKFSGKRKTILREENEKIEEILSNKKRLKGDIL